MLFIIILFLISCNLDRSKKEKIESDYRLNISDDNEDVIQNSKLNKNLEIVENSASFDKNQQFLNKPLNDNEIIENNKNSDNYIESPKLEKFKISYKDLKIIIKKYILNKLSNSSSKDIEKYIFAWLERLEENLVDVEEPWINAYFFENSLKNFLYKFKKDKRNKIQNWFEENFSNVEFENIIIKCFKDKKI